MAQTWHAVAIWLPGLLSMGCCDAQVMQDLEAKAEVVREQAHTHAQVVAAYDRVNASLQLANSEGHMYKTRIIQLEAEAKRDATGRRSSSPPQAYKLLYPPALNSI